MRQPQGEAPDDLPCVGGRRLRRVGPWRRGWRPWRALRPPARS